VTGPRPSQPRTGLSTGHGAASTPWWRRPSSWIALGLLVLSLAMIGFILASLVLPGYDQLPDRPDLANVLVAAFTFVALPSVGAVLAILRPSNPIGWFFLLAGAGFIVGIFSTEYVSRSVVLGADLPGYALVDWIGAWSSSVSLGLALVFIPLLFPDGHLPGPRWRPFAWLAAIVMILSILAQAVEPTGPMGPDGPTGYGGRLPNPIAMGGAFGDFATVVASLPTLAIFSLLALASLGLRYRRSHGVERQQLKWFLFAVGFLVVTAMVGFATQNTAVWYLVILGLALLPVAAAFAVLRYRLYDIDRIISRTVAYTIVSITLAIVFVGGVLGLTAVLEPFTAGNTIAVAAATLVVAALFQPLRGRIQSTVDRRFDRARYDGQRIAASFAARLRDQVDLEGLGFDLQGVVSETVAPASVGLWVRGVETEA
jgi:hypothetical protein